MSRVNRTVLRAAAAGLIASAGVAPAQTVILVRHAEKAAAPADDPPLTEAGRARSRLLAEALRGARVTRIVITSLRRTQETAAPTAAMARVQPDVVTIGSDTAAHVAATAALIRRIPKDAVVLVVGHSNTIPPLVAALGGTVPFAIPDCAFDKFVTMSLGRTPPATIVTRYGAQAENCPG